MLEAFETISQTGAEQRAEQRAQYRRSWRHAWICCWLWGCLLTTLGNWGWTCCAWTLCRVWEPSCGRISGRPGAAAPLYIPLLRPPDKTTAEDDRYVTALLRACPTYRLNDYTGPG